MTVLPLHAAYLDRLNEYERAQAPAVVESPPSPAASDAPSSAAAVLATATGDTPPTRDEKGRFLPRTVPTV